MEKCDSNADWFADMAGLCLLWLLFVQLFLHPQLQLVYELQEDTRHYIAFILMYPDVLD